MSSSSSSSKHPQASLNHTLVSMPTRDQSDRAEALLELSISLIESSIDVLRSSITTDEQLIRQSTLMPGGTLGKHFRHVIESFRAFLLPFIPPPSSSSLDQNKGTPEINYDSIHPTSRRPIARSIVSCSHALEEIRDDLIAFGDIARNFTSNSDGVGQGVAGESGVKQQRKGLAEMMEMKVNVVAITPTRQVMGSTVGRELWYCSLHAIHHFSMLRTIAVHEHGLELPVEFGTAPSTLLYRGLNWKPPNEDKEVRVAVKSKAKL
ncbi:hypothetical protein I302_101212 [Kwoniella bestiolae CBS 10118]|uniref:DinB-like domain-containing protein n=1 Tax=Kwoniella bestiolae CBS 10118 TaxID=1296100 RepID=A0A1B9G795_9TREE|nr:hypothetical protein I302_04585 [Kwoniella bestiolae CBS 10118]OCF26895.1 hypothetical protein I302_04585 [Kwoniella bestiolae CBS 10118]